MIIFRRPLQPLEPYHVALEKWVISKIINYYNSSDGPSAAKRRRRDEQRTLHAAAKAANAVNDEAHFAKVSEKLKVKGLD